MLKIQSLRFKIVLFVSLFTIYFSLFTVSYAAHPLITDDTGTQGKEKFQLELNSEFSHEDEDGATEDAFEFASVLSYGIADTIDIVLGVPYQHIRLKESGQNDSENGLSDISLELKWRFYEKDGLSLALKPGMTLPTGDDDKGLGSGKATYSAFFITTKEVEHWAFHLNLGYIRNENKSDERKDLWHASVAAGYGITEKLTLVGNIGLERNVDRNVNTNPAFILGGLIYSISENLDIDFGVKGGLNKPEADYSVLAGLAWRF
jgi:hypothetical protein